MQISRRNFLYKSSAALSIAVLSGGLTRAFGREANVSALYTIPTGMHSDPLFSMTAKQLGAYVGHEFSAKSSGGSAVRLILAEVNPIERRSNTTRGFYGESFSLVFVSKTKRGLRQDSYEFQSHGLGRFSALLVPTDRLKRRYEIIVNHVTP